MKWDVVPYLCPNKRKTAAFSKLCLGEHTDEPVLTQLVLKRHVCKGCQHAPPILDVNQIQLQGT